jgi:prepilin-type N-terminal cleavage/methylation domain-containing protein
MREGPRERQAGFTLIELLILVAIIGLIFAITLPTRFKSLALAHEAKRNEIIALRNAESVAARLEQGQLIWSVPREFKLRGVEVIVVRLVPDHVLRDQAARHLFRVTARLIATDGFNVRLLSQETQALGPTAPKWEWLIEPKESGDQRLGLALDVCDEPDLCKSAVAWKQVKVAATIGQRLANIGYENWKFAAGALGTWALGRGGTWWRTRRKRRQQARDLRETIQRPR